MKALVSFTVCLVGAFDIAFLEGVFAVLVVCNDLAVFATGFLVDVEVVEVEPVDVD
jgi:hypothetical protein